MGTLPDRISPRKGLATTGDLRHEPTLGIPAPDREEWQPRHGAAAVEPSWSRNHGIVTCRSLELKKLCSSRHIL